MGSFKALQPRANPPVCWGCDRMLFAGGRIYTMIEGHPYHSRCAPQCQCGKADCAHCMPEPAKPTRTPETP